MADPALTSLALILALGIGASWLAWRLELPSILLLLLAGFVAGPVTGWLDPDALFGDLLLPFVAYSVAIILFEGGLSLRTVELREVGKVVRNLVTFGVVTTWAILAAAAYLLLDLGLEMSLLLGAILVVTGPTVIIPLLRHLRPKGQIGNVLKWEGILIDPIGVVLAVVVFEAILVGGLAATEVVLTTILSALLVGGVLGVLGAAVTYIVLKRHWLPDVLQSPATLATVVVVFAASEALQPESGLVSATLMGVVLANQGDLAKRHIIEFKENLRTLLISFLFIVLAARLELSDLSVISVESLLFLGVVFLVARPVGVWFSTLGSSLDWRERAFLSVMAPRGIVAAAISSVFAIELVDQGFAGADQLVPLTFLVIIATVGVYGLGAPILGRFLGIAEPNPQGALIVGAQPWAREVGQHLVEAGVTVVMVDTNRSNLQEAWDMGLRTHRGNTLHEHVLDELDLKGIGHMMAVTPNDEVNALTVLNFREAFERSNLYQLCPSQGAEIGPERVSQDLRGRLLFGAGMTHSRIRELLQEGWEIKAFPMPARQDPIEPIILPWEVEAGPEVPVLLFVIKGQGTLLPATADETPSPEPGDTVVVLAPEDWSLRMPVADAEGSDHAGMAPEDPAGERSEEPDGDRPEPDQ